jgi:hypothetical protein
MQEIMDIHLVEQHREEMLPEVELNRQANALRATYRAACWPEIYSGMGDEEVGRASPQASEAMSFYTYWEGVPIEGNEMYLRDRCLTFTCPTNDGLVMTYVTRPVEEFHLFRSDIESHFLKTLDLAGDLGERVRCGQRAGRFRWTTNLPNFFRKPHGPNWALVSYAGLVMDPITSKGIGYALHDAELLADANEAQSA